MCGKGVGEWASGHSLTTRKLATRNLFSQEFPMGQRRTKRNENNATIFIPIRVLSYPCFHHPWLFSQENGRINSFPD